VLRVAGNFVVGTGDENDRVLEHQVSVGGDHLIDTGLGDDGVGIGPLPDPNNPDVGGDPNRPALRAAHNVVIELGDGEDRMHINGAAIGGSLSASGGAQNDSVAVQHARMGNTMRLGTDGGDDHVSVHRVAARRLHIGAGDGNDRVSIVGAALRELVVELGAGDDGLAIGHTHVSEHAVLRAGDGEDTLVSLGGNRFSRILIAGFEHRMGPSMAPASNLAAIDGMAGML
jgi:hypothetical protein